MGKTEMAVRLNEYIRLRGGNAVGYAEYGVPNGVPILHFHGFPSSRFECNRTEIVNAANDLNARVIVVERPGIGLSDFIPYSIDAWPNIVSEFADVLELERFSVVGLSAGGKYAAACAWRIPDRIENVGIISTTCPYDTLAARSTMTITDKLLYTVANRTPFLMSAILRYVTRAVRSEPTKLFSLFPDLPQVDTEVLNRPEVLSVFSSAVNGAFTQGPRGVVHDWGLEGLPWGFSVEDISVPVRIWHGELDTIQPIAQGEIMAACIPHANPTYMPGEGHISLFVNHYPEILAELVKPVATHHSP
jgi:pimeloyl-ACP methyl ester carboxylesterase